MSLGSSTSLLIDRIVTPVAGMHRTISGRWLNAGGRLGKRARPVHDALTTGVYESIRLAGALAGFGIDAAGLGGGGATVRTQAILNGLWGDHLGRHGARLEIPMSVRDRAGNAVPPDQLAERLPEAGRHLVVLVHGFADTERCWLPKDPEAGLAPTISEQIGQTPILIRYNTGLPIEENGSRLAELLDRLHAEWSVPVDGLALIGHSMGGLVIRSAVGAAHAKHYRWPTVTRHVMTLGTPHLGTPTEKLVSVLASGLGVTRETAQLQDFLDTRSQGIRDLRFGVSPNILPYGIEEHCVAGVATNNPTHPMGSLFGDLVVRIPSATGGPEANPADVVVANRVRHNQLVRDRRVIEHILRWLQT